MALLKPFRLKKSAGASASVSRERLRALMRQVRAIEIRTRRLVAETFGGQYHSIFRGRGIDFDEVREYVAGDDVRAIDWNVTARAGRPFVKRFREERELTVIVAVDASASLAYGSGDKTKRELAAELASVLALAAAANRDRAGLVLFTDKVEQYLPPRRGRAQSLRIVRDVLGWKPESTGTDLAAPLRFLCDVLKRRAVVFWISDFARSEISGPPPVPQSGFARTLGMLSPPIPKKNSNDADVSDLAPLRSMIQLANRRHDLVAMQVSDPREFALPSAGWVNFQDAETGRQLLLPTGFGWVRERYAHAAIARQEALNRFFSSLGIDFLHLSTQRPYTAELARFFQRRAGRRR